MVRGLLVAWRRTNAGTASHAEVTGRGIKVESTWENVLIQLKNNEYHEAFVFVKMGDVE
jgi:hypothetical protein